MRLSRLSIGTFSSQSAENYCEAPYNVSEILEYGKILCLMGWYHDFSSKILSLTLPEKNSGNPFIFHKISASKKFLHKRDNTKSPKKFYGLEWGKVGVSQFFRRKNVVSQYRKTS